MRNTIIEKLEKRFSDAIISMVDQNVIKSSQLSIALIFHEIELPKQLQEEQKKYIR